MVFAHDWLTGIMQRSVPDEADVKGRATNVCRYDILMAQKLTDIFGPNNASSRSRVNRRHR